MATVTSRQRDGSDRQLLVAYLAVGVVFALAVALQTVGNGAVDWFVNLPASLIEPHFRAAAVAVCLGLGIAAVPAAMVRYSAPPEERTPVETVLTVVGAVALVGFVAAIWIQGATDLPIVRTGLLRPLVVSGIAFVVPAVAVAFWRGHDLALRVPERAAHGTTALAVVGACLLGLAWNATMLTFFGDAIGPFEGTIWPGFYELSGPVLVFDIGLPAAFFAIGTAVLVLGAIYTWLRSASSTAPAVASATILIAGRDAFVGAVAPRSFLLLTASNVGIAVAVVALAAVTGGAIHLLESSRELSLPAPAAVVVALTVVALAQVMAWAVGVAVTPGGVLYASAFAITAGVAVLAFERTESVWVPAATLLAFEVVTAFQVLYAIGRLIY